MNKFWLLILTLVLLALICSCAGTCIRVDGSYKDFDGGIEYCFDTQQSKDLGIPVINEHAASGDNTFFGFDLDQVNEIVEKLKDKIGIKANESETVHPVTELLEILKEQENAE